MISREVVDWINQRKTGCILYTSPSRNVREAALKAMAQIAVCKQTPSVLSCDCADCFNIKEGKHPHVSIITDETFDEKMSVLYSYPTPIVQLHDSHKISKQRQTKLLIWLESLGRQRFVMLGTDTEFSVLPTIRSRSVIFTEIPRYKISPDDEFKAQVFLQAIFSGKERFDSISTPDDARHMAFILRHMVVEELQGRMMKPVRKKLPGNELELTTLMKVLERFLSDPAVHNLRLLMSGFSMIPLQGMR